MTEFRGLLKMTKDEIHKRYPLHWCVWSDNSEKLDELLSTKLYNPELTDAHGRTPLSLAVALNFVNSVKVLLHHSCNASAVDKQGWNVTQEAVGTGEPELISLIIQHREFQRFNQKSGGITEILESLEEADDFYVEMKWDFSSWVPLVSRMCPNDSYKIFKSVYKFCKRAVQQIRSSVVIAIRTTSSNVYHGYKLNKQRAAVRVDTTLKGFDQMNWQRGNQSYIFKGGEKNSELFEIDHDKKCYWRESVSIRDDSMTLDELKPPPSVIQSRLFSQNVTSILDHDNIAFVRQKSGILGWGGDKTDTINGYEAKVFTVSGVELVTRTRMEHLTEEDRIRIQEEKRKAQSQAPVVMNLLNQQEHIEELNVEDIKDRDSFNPYQLTIEDYFNPKLHPGKDVGKLKKMTSKTQKFSATVALSDDFPLSLQDQVLPIINLMANSSSHFAKLRDFITLQLPAGFPVKIEIPLFHVLNARITFTNINGSDQCPEGVVLLDVDDVTTTEESEGAALSSSNKKKKCVIDKSIFTVHQPYKDLGLDVSMYRDNADSLRDEEDEFLQIAIQQSLAEASGSTSSTDVPLSPTSPQNQQTWLISSEQEEQDEYLQRVIRESLGETNTTRESEPSILSEEEQLRLVMQLSLQEDQAAEQRRNDEESELKKVLALSLAEQ